MIKGIGNIHKINRFQLGGKELIVYSYIYSFLSE